MGVAKEVQYFLIRVHSHVCADVRTFDVKRMGEERLPKNTLSGNLKENNRWDDQERDGERE